MPEQGADHDRKKNLEESLLEKLEELSGHLTKAGIAEYIDFMRNPKRVIFSNFLGGVARGVGTAVGFTLIGALVILFLSHLARLNLPVIGKYIATVVRIVEMEMRLAP